jgi:hypothetical protein
MIYRCPTCGCQVFASTPVVSDIFGCKGCCREMTLDVGSIAYLWAVVLVLYGVPASWLVMIVARLVGETILFVKPLPWSEILLNGLLVVPCVAFVSGLLLGLFVATGIKAVNWMRDSD